MSDTTGRIVAVNIEYMGDELTEPAAVGATTLYVDDAMDFAEEGGSLLFNDAVLSFTGADADRGEIYLADPVPAEAVGEEGDMVYLWDASTNAPVVDYVAQVAVEGMEQADDMLEATVDHALIPFLPEGIRQEGFGEAVRIEYDGDDLYVTDILGRAPVFDGGLIEPGTLTLTDGQAPLFAPAVSAQGGIGVLYLSWPEVDNADPVSYVVYMSETSGFPLDASTQVGVADATVVSVEREPGEWFIRVVARDGDGAGPPSAEVSATVHEPVDLTELEGDLSALEGSLSAAEGAITDLQGDLTGLDGDLTALDTRLGAAETGLGDLAGDLADSFPIVGTQVTDGAISTEKLSANAVTAEKIGAGAVTAGKIDAGAVTTEKVDARAITAAKIATGTITANEIGAGAVTAAKIDAGAVTTAKLDAEAVTAEKIGAREVTAAKIATGTITADEIASETITADKIATGAITAEKIDADAINGKTITGATFRTAESGERLEINTEPGAASRLTFYSDGLIDERPPGRIEARFVTEPSQTTDHVIVSGPQTASLLDRAAVWLSASRFEGSGREVSDLLLSGDRFTFHNEGGLLTWHDTGLSIYAQSAADGINAPEAQFRMVQGSIIAKADNEVSLQSGGSSPINVEAGGAFFVRTGGSASVSFQVGAGGVVRMYNDLRVDGTADIRGQLDVPNMTSGGSANVNYNSNNGRLRVVSSSRRFKTNVETLDTDTDAVLALEPRRYDRIDDEDSTVLTPEVGFIAEEAQALGLDDYIVRDRDGEVFSFDYYKFAAVAHHAVIREQQARIDELEARVDEQQARNDALEARLTALERGM